MAPLPHMAGSAVVDHCGYSRVGAVTGVANTQAAARAPQPQPQPQPSFQPELITGGADPEGGARGALPNMAPLPNVAPCLIRHPCLIGHSPSLIWHTT
eukprot:6055329-Prymnesium_polylepis.3